jgi:hypothetical protein
MGGYSLPGWSGMRPMRWVLMGGLALTIAACRGVDDPTLPMPTATAAGAPEQTAAAQSNACPVDGCKVGIQNAEDAGEEITLTFSSNYTPEISGNHYHVYWDRFDSKQVSDDAETKHGVTQGEWESTADNPFTTTGAAGVGQRGQSTRICVTPGDVNHNVIDPAVVDCRDVASLL